MARNRTIGPDSWTDEKLADLDAWTHLLWVGLVSQSDDEGRIEWKPAQIKLKIFPAKNCSVDEIASWMSILCDRKLVVRYEADGRSYGYHPAWHKHQHVNRPTESKLPDPPGVPKRYVRSDKGGVKKLPEPSAMLPLPGLTEYSVSPTRISVSESVSVSELGERDAHEVAKSDSTHTVESRPECEERALSPAIAFAQWFVSAGIDAGALPDVVDEVAYAYRQAEVAGRLLALHGRPECEERAHLLFAAHLASGPDRILRRPGIDALEACWSWKQLSGVPLRVFGAPRKSFVSKAPAYTPPTRPKQFWQIVDGERILVRAS